MKDQEIIDSNHKTEQLTATESQKITVLENGNLMTVSDEGSYMGLFENKDCGDVWLAFDITEVIKPQYIRSLADIKRIVELEKAASTQKGLWVTSDDLQVWRLEQQAKGRLDGVAYALNMYCTTMPPNEFPPIGEYYAGQLQTEDLKESKR
jgi:hypothetical protein